MRFLYFLLSILLSGCSADKASHTLSNTVDRALIASSGNKPPSLFAFASPARANGYVMQDKDYSFTMPLTKASDWTKMTGWRGASDFQGMGIFLNDPEAHIHITLKYNIGISSYVGKYGEMQRAVENNNVSYIRSHIRIDSSDKLYFKHYGKEKYLCKVMEYTKENYKGKRFMGIDCYKFNYSKTKYKSVIITLTYTKSPRLPAKYKSLAKQYTYKDLQNRAKRMLDSLYIKDGW